MLQLAGITTLVIMLIVGADVGMRYVLNAPFSWSYDLIGIYLVPISFFFALSATFRQNHHISVDILYLRFPQFLQKLARLGVALIFGPFAFWIVLLAVEDSRERYLAGNAISGTILWPTWIPAAIVAVGFSALTLRLLLDGAALIVAFVRGTTEVVGESPARASASVKAEDEL
ncbi:TRAP transporter small permease [Chelativorans sp. Marseille-P2723]|uniref:TRAP transporter small permease n=1 Tax=Chelativorans sp. Marseille-P2723 TaxID=2709133 RepID=UPI00156FD18C|nr:TRAP transporter small permease [Chelativorans sp. Marseille-P2723]